MLGSGQMNLDNRHGEALGKSQPVPVSAVIPCFNSARTLMRAVQSIEKQTAKPIELIIVDDASTDNTAKLCDQLRASYGDQWIKVIRLTTNCGVSDARNAGWNQASGDYVAFLDADDCWHPEKLRLQYEFMKRHPQVALSGHAYVYGTEAWTGARLQVNDAVAGKIVAGWTTLLRNPFITPSVMLKRDLKVRFDGGQRHMEDHLLWMRLALQGALIVYLPIALASVFKAPYGSVGLSGDMRAMYEAEQQNIVKLIEAGHLPRAIVPVLTTFVFLKYLRRKLLVKLRMHRGRLHDGP